MTNSVVNLEQSDRDIPSTALYVKGPYYMVIGESQSLTGTALVYQIYNKHTGVLERESRAYPTAHLDMNTLYMLWNSVKEDPDQGSEKPQNPFDMAMASLEDDEGMMYDDDDDEGGGFLH